MKSKIFKVPLHQVSQWGYVSDVDTVIVQKTGFGRVKEILTGYSKIDVVSSANTSSSYTTDIDFVRIYKEGAMLIVYYEDLCAQNRATAEDIDAYVEQYDQSKWKKLYTEMKVLSAQEKEKLMNKVKQVMGTRK